MAPGHDSDRADRLAVLLEEARAGRRESLNEIVADLTPLLWHLVRSQGLPREPAQDVLQTVWLRLLDHLDSIRSPRALTRWLVTVARREAWAALETARTGQRLDEQAALDIADAAAAPDEQLVIDESRRLLWTAVSQLDDRCQQLLRVVAFAPRASYTAIAEALDMPVGSIGPTRGRCLGKLRTLLAADPTGSWT